MPWTLTLLEPKEPQLLEAFLLAVGKALCLANNFESRISHHLSLVAWIEAREEGAGKKDAADAVKRAGVLPLARKLSRIHGAGDITDEDLLLLDKARAGRNYIAHESASIGELHGATESYLLQKIASLYPHVMAVAVGDNLASKWEYEVSEREPAPRYFMEEYVGKVMVWVFGSLLSTARTSSEA
jgi:hypothetical protein